MREIKFRAWDKKENTMINELNPCYLNSKDLVVMQYTGLKDKNGTEIYEGDIVEHEYLGKGEVMWDGVITGFYIYVDASDEGCLYLSNPDTGEVGVEIIGNIHEKVIKQ